MLVARVFAGALACCVVGGAAAQDGAVVRTGKIDDDVFAAGSSVDVRANISGDVFVAGGWVDLTADVADNVIAGGGLIDVGGRTAGDLIVAGGILDVAGEVGDNVVATAASLDVEATVGSKLFASAGRLKVGALSHVSNDAWLAGGVVDVAGAVEGDTVISAGRTTLRGRFGGDVTVNALTLTLTDGTEISGDLIHHGPEPPVIEDGAQVRGRVRYDPEPPPEREASRPPFFWLGIVAVLGLMLDVLVPSYLRQAGRQVLARPLTNLGLGAAILVTTPVLVLLLFLSVLASALGLAVMAVYGTLLLVGPVAAVFGLVDHLFARAGQEPGPGRRRLAFLAGIAGLGLIGWLPYVGTPAMWVVSVVGLGAAAWQLYASLSNSGKRNGVARPARSEASAEPPA